MPRKASQWPKHFPESNMTKIIQSTCLQIKYKNSSNKKKDGLEEIKTHGIRQLQRHDYMA